MPASETAAKQSKVRRPAINKLSGLLTVHDVERWLEKDPSYLEQYDIVFLFNKTETLTKREREGNVFV